MGVGMGENLSIYLSISRGEEDWKFILCYMR